MGVRTISGQCGGGKKAGTTNAVDLELSKSASNFCIREWEKSTGESVVVAHWFDNSSVTRRSEWHSVLIVVNLELNGL